MAQRKLSLAEEILSVTVFSSKLPFWKIRIKDDLGLFDRPWTEPTIFGEYVLHMGPKAYPDCTSSNGIIANGKRIRDVFIHECVHAWQGHHGMNYVLNSLMAQCTAGTNVSSAYNYELGKNWSEYNAEQQGKIVEDWFRNGRLSTDLRFRYIRDNIRKGLIAP